MYKIYIKEPDMPKGHISKFLLIMRLTTVILIFSFMQVYAAGFAQKISITQSNAPLKIVLKELRSQSGYNFVYTNDLLKIAKPVNIKVTGAEFEDVLIEIFKEQPLTYSFNKNTITVKEKHKIYSANVIENLTELNDIVVRGKISDAKGETLIGVSVKVKGTTMGTSTDVDGNYSISVNENATIVFSYIGYVTKEVVVNNQSLINVVLTETTSTLNEVVVTALGIDRKKESLTYSAQVVNPENFSEARELNAINSLKGRVAGMTITNSGDGISSRPKVLLRGSRSITGNNEPLYVTDGVPGDMGLLDPNNIESITVLKGSAAAAAYGSAGQNGAIMITTKKGKVGKFAVNYIGGVSFDQAQILSDFQYEYGQGDQGIFYPNSENSWGPKATGQPVTLWNGKTVPLEGQINRFKEFYQVGKTLNNSINISGGSEKIQTYFSYGNANVEGVLRDNNNLNRHTVDFKMHNNISSKFSFNVNVTYNRENTTISSQYPYSSVFVTPVTIPIGEMKDYKYLDSNGNIQQNYWRPNSLGSNPYFNMNGDISSTLSDRVMGFITAKYKFSEAADLQIRARVNNNSLKNELKKYSGISTVQSVWGSDYNHNTNLSNGSYVDALFNYSKDLGKNIKLSGNLGASMENGRNEGVSSHARGLYKDDFFFLGNSKAIATTNTFSRSPQIQGIYAMASLSYKRYLYMDVTARNDWSSALPKEDQSYFYPSIGLTAIISEIFKMPSWVSFGKSRISFAQTGYGGIQYLDRNYYSVGFSGAIITPPIQSLGNYKPELTNSIEAGLEWRFFNDKLGFNFTYYNTATKNQLLLIGAPSASLFDQRYINAGFIRNNGIELELFANPVRTKDFSWDLSFNFATNKNKVVELTDEIKSVIISGGVGSANSVIKAVEGDPFGDIYVKGWRRDASGRKLVNNVGLPLLTGGQEINVGNYNPNYLMGLSNSLSFKRYSLSFLVDYRNGGQVISSSQALLDGRGHTKATLAGREGGLILDAYTVDGSKNTKAITPQSYFSTIGDIYLAGEFYNYSATNMRLRELTMSYAFPVSLFKKGNVKDLKFSLVGRNLFFFHRLAPFDPEIGSIAGNSGGQEFSYIPPTRNIGFNVKLSF